MKTKIIFLFATVALIFSCSSDDSGSGTTNYLPLKTGNYWTYDVINPNLTNRDSLYVANDTLINSKTYKKMKTKNIAAGFYCGALNNNAVKIEGGKLVVSGGIDVTNLGLPINLDLTLNDFIFFNENATSGILSTYSGTTTQTVQGLDLVIDYTMSSEAASNLASFTSPNGDIYQNVHQSKIKLNLKISTIVSGLNATILLPQDVLVSNLYFAKDIGMVYAKTDITYEVNPFLPINIPNLPSSGSQTSEEFLDTYLVAN